MFDARPQHNEYLRHRSAQFRQQVQRRLDGSLTEAEFKPLRLMNGVYLQLHAYMLRVAIPYGTISPDQMRTLALLARKWDKGYGHGTTRQNIQYNWPTLVDIPDMLDALAEVGLHAIQTSGNTIRNVTTDAYAGAAADEVADPRPYGELIRQWSTDHAEYQFLPRKFKIAITGSEKDRAVIAAHDIGLRLKRNDKGEIGYQVWIGGGLGRTPMIGQVVREFLPEADLLPYIEAIIAVYNLSGRRDNKYKARIKITVAERGLDVMREEIEAEFLNRREVFSGVDQDYLAALKAMFAAPDFRNAGDGDYEAQRAANPAFRSWTDTNFMPHKAPGYASVKISFKAPGQTPGDASAEQMDLLADLAERYGHHDLRISHDQNVVMPHVHKSDLFALYQELKAAGLATANAGLISDIVACPGMDYCALATARSIPIAEEIAAHFRARDIESEIGKIDIRISGCINACGHHHLGHIGILGLDRAGVENYQITLGGDGYDIPAVGQKPGAGFGAEDVVAAVDRIINTYLEVRESEEERFIDAYRRVGMAPFKAALYPAHA